MPLILVFDTRKEEPFVFNLVADRYTIGVGSDCDIVVMPRHPVVSEHHATLIKNDNVYVIEDGVDGVPSEHGLWIGENVISRTRVYPKTRKFNEEVVGYDVRRVSERQQISSKQLENEETIWFHKDFKVGIKYFA